MASTGWLIFFGVLLLIVGIIMVIMASVWKSRSVDKKWTSGMIAVLVIGIILIIISIILFIVAYFNYVPIASVETNPPEEIISVKTGLYNSPEEIASRPARDAALKSKINYPGRVLLSNPGPKTTGEAYAQGAMIRAQNEAIQTYNEKVFERPIKDVLTGETTDFFGLREKCRNLDYDTLREYVENIPEYEYACDNVLVNKKIERGESIFA